MMNVKISHQKATAIARTEFDAKLPPKNESYLLKTGAKLACRYDWVPKQGWKKTYWVCGYSSDGADVKPYAPIS